MAKAKKKAVVYIGTGRRKEATARVRLTPGTGQFSINGGRTLEEHFPRLTHQIMINKPLEATENAETFDIFVRVNGGGTTGQAGALRHGISRALLEVDPEYRAELKKGGFLTRDAREKERKKYGLRKARKKPQFSKR